MPSTSLVVALGVAATPLRLAPGAPPGNERIVVLVLAPPAAANHYLQIVAALARTLRSDLVVERLAAARSPQAVLDIPEIRDLVVQPRLAVRDLMTQRVFRVYPDTPVGELLDLMIRHDLKAVPVVGEKREVLGIVTDRDLLRFLLPQVVQLGTGERTEERPERSAASSDTPVREIMSRSVMCISEDQGLAELASIMVNKDVERLPVVQRGQAHRLPHPRRHPAQALRPVAKLTSGGPGLTPVTCKPVTDLMSRTLAIVKPDAVASGHAGKIIAHLEQRGLPHPRAAHDAPHARAGRRVLRRPPRAPLLRRAGGVHDLRPRDPLALERADAVATLRHVIGATDPAEAAEGTVRKLYAESKGRNAIHASDSDENAAVEVAFFFSTAELVGNG